VKRVILIGMSGTGKTTIARELARQLDFNHVDIDEEIVMKVGMSIPRIFEQLGEPAFRAVERSCLEDACSRSNRVIATGGGVVIDEQNWIAMRPNSLIVHLTASSDAILGRLRAQSTSDPDTRRPLLESNDPATALRNLWESRRALYQRADLTIDTTDRHPDSIISEIESAVEGRGGTGIPVPIGCIGTPNGRSDLFVAPGLIEHAGELVRGRFQDSRRAWIITDSNVGPLWAKTLSAGLHSVDFEVELLQVPAGESSKSLDRVSDLLDALLKQRVERRDVVVALGGGVVGDLAGFVAAIALRGLPLVQVPSSLLAMVDSSVGGKTGVNHERGKNLIGAFYQPQIVIADPSLLATLPDREVRGGWGEIIKHGMIESTATGTVGAPLLDRIESADDGTLRDPSFMADIVRRNVLIKRAVVQADERESGIRRILNYGHTLGHAMEASGYRYHHGEAVALGMRAAALLAIRIGRSSNEVAARQNALIDRFGLPSRFEGSLADVIEHLGSDKKTIDGKLTWILPTKSAGVVDIVTVVPADEVEATAAAIGATP
jgi:shikimate kinase/3-dehydroquinate synthase